MKTLGFSAHCATMFAGMVLGLFLSGSFFINYHLAQASQGGDIVCLVFTELGGMGTPIPVLNGGSCPSGSTPTEPENTQALCSDGLDNDDDGLVDLVDPDCAAFVPPPEPADVCPNIDDVQEAVPEGYELDSDGNCVEQTSDGDTGDEDGDTGEEESDTNTDTGGGGDDSNPAPSDSGGSSPSTSSGSTSGGNGVIGGPLSVGYQNPSGEVLGTTTVAAEPAVLSTCSSYLGSYLRRGKQNDSAEVKKLQTFLNEHMASGLPVTGYFGPLTDRAVRSFQLKYSGEILAPWVPFGLQSSQTATGYVYKTTLRKINNIMCTTLNLPIPLLP